MLLLPSIAASADDLTGDNLIVAGDAHVQDSAEVGAFRIETNHDNSPHLRYNEWRRFTWASGSAEADRAWKKVARLNPRGISTGTTYNGIAFEGRIFNHRTNHGADRGVSIPFSGSVRGYTYQSDPRNDTGIISQGIAENINYLIDSPSPAESYLVRLVRVAENDFELQVRAAAYWRYMEVEWRITSDYSGAQTIEFFDQNSTLLPGSAGGTPIIPAFDHYNSVGTLWAGKIGIGGVTSPTAALDVAGDGKISGNLAVAGSITAAGGQQLVMRNTNGVTPITNGSYSFNLKPVSSGQFLISPPSDAASTLALASAWSPTRSADSTLAIYGRGSDWNKYLILTHDGTSGHIQTAPSGGDIVFSPQLSERMRITTSGKVGIGTNAPTEALHVDGNILTPSIKTNAANSSTSLQVTGGVSASTAYGVTFFEGRQVGSEYTNYDNPIFSAKSDNPNGAANYFFRGKAAAATTFEVRADGKLYTTGNIGINTTTPSEKLEVVGNTKVGGTLTVNGSSAIVGDLNVTGTIINPALATTGSGSTTRLRVGGTTNPSASWQGTTVTGADDQNKVITGYLGSSTNGATIGAHNSALSAWADLNVAGSNVILRTSETERMRIHWNGNVGINMSMPATKLEVLSTSNGLSIPIAVKNFVPTQSGGSAVGIGFLVHDGYGPFWKAAIAHERLGDWGVGSLHFLVNNSTGSSVTLDDARMTITKEGNVGIGTKTPSAQQKLQVVGNANFTGAVTAGSADFSGGLAAGSANVSGNLTIAGNLSGVNVIGNVTMKNRAVIRVSPAGDIDMGVFKSGADPEL